MRDDGNGVVDIAVEAFEDGRNEMCVDEALYSRLHRLLALRLNPPSSFRRGLCPTRAKPSSFLGAKILFPQLRQLYDFDRLARRIEARLCLGDSFRSPEGTL